jgi:predicted PurR-regulated permease PerM
VALITKPLTGTAQAAHQARQWALPIVAAGVLFASLYFGRLFFITLISAVIIAFILEPFVVLLLRLRLPRSLASFIVCAIGLLFLYVIGMGAYSQLSMLYDDLPKYGERIGDIIDSLQQKLQGMENRTYEMLVPARQRQQQQEQERLR